jgi:hypothetical protein
MGFEPIFVGIKRDAIVYFHPLNPEFLEAIGRKPSPEVIGLVYGKLGKLNDFFPFHDQWYQFSHNDFVYFTKESLFSKDLINNKLRLC